MDLRGNVLEADIMLTESPESRLRRERLNSPDKVVKETFDLTDSGREEEGVGVVEVELRLESLTIGASVGGAELLVNRSNKFCLSNLYSSSSSKPWSFAMASSLRRWASVIVTASVDGLTEVVERGCLNWRFGAGN